MKKRSIKLLSLLLAFTMILPMPSPIGALAAEIFSVFHVFDGYIGYENNRYGNGLFYLNNRDNHTFYVEPGHTLRFNRDAAWFSRNPLQGVTANGYTVTVAADAQIGSQVTYNVQWTGGGGGRATVTIIVAGRKQILEEQVLANDKYPVVLTILDNATTIPSEPGATIQDCHCLTDQYQKGAANVTFSDSAQDIIDSSIADALINSVDGTNTIGVADPTGENCLKYLIADGISWDGVLDAAIANNVTALDGRQITDANRNEYQVIPYVIKLMSGNKIGWRIDCAIVPKVDVTLAYNMNLEHYVVEDEIVLPAAASGIPAPSFETTVGSITYNNTPLSTDGKVSAAYGGTAYNLSFKGWNTSPDGSGTTYDPGGSVSITEDTTLYAIWEGELVSDSADLTITMTCGDSGEMFTFYVVNTDANINMTVVVPANGRVTINDLPLGSYSVTEDVSWSYRYTCEGTSTIRLEAGKANTLTFSGVLINDKWLGGEDAERNVFDGKATN